MLFHEELTGAARWFVPLLVFAGVLFVGLVLRALLFRTLSHWSRQTSTKIDDYLIAATKWASYLWIVILGLLAAFQTVDLPGEQFDVAVRRVLGALLILSVTMGASRFFGDLVMHSRDSTTELPIASTGLLRTVVRLAVSTIGGLLVLGTLGINIAPLLGALGVGGLAAGLALQPTLSNLFAGFQIAVTRQVRMGNRVRLSSGEDGYVTDISWRTTTLRTPNNHLILVPNSKFADSIITNYSLPDPMSIITLSIGVPYESDPRRVDTILRDEARRLVSEIPELVKDFDPTVRLQAFGDSALQFNVVLRVRDYDAQFAVWGELHQRLFARLEREGIHIPFPTHTVYWHGEQPAPQRPN